MVMVPYPVTAVAAIVGHSSPGVWRMCPDAHIWVVQETGIRRWRKASSPELSKTATRPWGASMQCGWGLVAATQTVCVRC